MFSIHRKNSQLTLRRYHALFLVEELQGLCGRLKASAPDAPQDGAVPYAQGVLPLNMGFFVTPL